MNQYSSCPRCGRHIINRMRFYDLCGCQVLGMLEEQSPAEREAGWIKQAMRLYKRNYIDDAAAIAEAILLDNPKSQAAQELLAQCQALED